jgi:nucleoside-diphosphate-sugar epimerase
MSNIITIGHTGFLGSYLKDRFDTETWPGRFEWSSLWWSRAAEDYWADCNTIFYCARTCRKESPRRDRETVMLDTQGIIKTLQSFPTARIIYCSTKVVDGWTDDWERPISRKEIGDYFERALVGDYKNQTIQIPEHMERTTPIKKPLSHEHTLYANTKSIGELLVKSCTKDYTIFRIWDIEQ